MISPPMATSAAALHQRVGLAGRLDLPRRVTLSAAGAVLVIVALLLAFIGWNGTRIFFDGGASVVGVLGATWAPTDGVFGILPFILGTLGVMVVAALIAAP